MTNTRIPDITTLEQGTVELLRKGASDRDNMRRQLAARFQFGRADQACGSSSTITPGPLCGCKHGVAFASSLRAVTSWRRENKTRQRLFAPAQHSPNGRA